VGVQFINDESNRFHLEHNGLGKSPSPKAEHSPMGELQVDSEAESWLLPNPP
jgi:hypothetical protein